MESLIEQMKAVLVSNLTGINLRFSAMKISFQSSRFHSSRVGWLLVMYVHGIGSCIEGLRLQLKVSRCLNHEKIIHCICLLETGVVGGGCDYSII